MHKDSNPPDDIFNQGRSFYIVGNLLVYPLHVSLRKAMYSMLWFKRIIIKKYLGLTFLNWF